MLGDAIFIENELLFLLADDLMFFVAPGFANNSETDYIRTFMKYVNGQGYRCAVLNHIGTIPDIPVTSPRIFSFGW